MTEYDYSPEAYERHLNTQRRIATWVDRTETYRPQFASALSPPSDYIPHQDPEFRSMRPSRRLQRRQSQHRSRSPSVDSASSEEYGYGPNHPGPMPIRSAPGHLGGFPAAQMPWNQGPPPMVAPQSRVMSPNYYGVPGYRDMQLHRRTHSHGSGHRMYPAQPMMYSPPVSPGVYGYPAPPYVMMHQQQGRPIPYVYL